MVAKDYQKSKGSNKAEVGEIDTSAPFQSVKDAVNLFGEGAFSGERPAIRKPKAQSAERVFVKETQLHLAQKELNKLKEQLKNAEATKVDALSELEKAKQTVEDLSQRLRVINESKDSAIKSTEAAKRQANQLAEANNNVLEGVNGHSNGDVETDKAQYLNAVAELNAAKQELRKIRQEYDASLEEKERAAKQAAVADTAAKANMERVGELSAEIASVHESIQQVKLAHMQAKEDETKICADKEKQKQLYKDRIEDSVKRLAALKKDVDPEVARNLESELNGTLSEIESLRKEMENTRVSDLGSVKAVTVELIGAKESLNKVAEEESSLRSLVETLKVELENIKKVHAELKEQEAETESLAGNLHVQLRKAKSELEEGLAEEAKIRGASDELVASIHQLTTENEAAKIEAQEMKQKAEELSKEAEAARIELEEAENKLEIAMKEAEEAKAAEVKALDQIKMLSEKTDAARASTSEPGAQITLSRDEFESLSRKVEESEKLSDMKVAAAMAQVEAVQASEHEALQRLEATRKEIEDMKAATQEALKKAEMAEAARKAVEGELRRWREREQKKAEEAAARILAETEKSLESSPSNYQIQKPRAQVKEKARETKRLEKAKTSVSKKALMPSLSYVFQKKKNKVEGGSPSFLPGERPVW
ncbi:WEB family protein At5g55860 [Salvia hispanica]|uniref:WEB family protein At5g55860 n=1 Tax=Salvia hispanica TaxID=49212 RepID=UPI002009CFF6|nr:WEB family protein At5g55860 [Salvia hispanica]XP_047983013.1 WEB family protein At5g55860 [Salvia hispanica]XP_047983015.1 WEB family protein At5g55860 [Salvia hispanica]